MLTIFAAFTIDRLIAQDKPAANAWRHLARLFSGDELDRLHKLYKERRRAR